MAAMSNMGSVEGMMLRMQIAQATDSYIKNIPNMSAFEMGHDLGYGVEKATEAFLLSKGAGIGVNVTRVGVGQAVFESSLIGGRSALFGRARLGWSYRNGTHYFQPRLGSKYGAKHYRYWLKYRE